MSGIYLFESKTKGDIDEPLLVRQLSSGFDLQTMIYLTALGWYNQHDEAGNGLPRPKTHLGSEILGIRYNVIRRPLSGGRGDIRQKVDETAVMLCNRLVEKIKKEPGNWFMRWKIEISSADIAKFRRQCLNPILEQLCGWWEYVTTGRNSLHALMPLNWRHPFGVYNPLDEGKSSDLDEYLRSGSMVGLQKTTNLFPELSEGV